MNVFFEYVVSQSRTLSCDLPSSRKATSISSVCKKCRKNSSNVYGRSRALSPTALMWNGSLLTVSSISSSSFSPNINHCTGRDHLSPVTIGTFFPCAPPCSYGLCGHSLFQNLETAHPLCRYTDEGDAAGSCLRPHLILAQPARRLKEFETRDGGAKLFCTQPLVKRDFFTIEAPHISILNWLLGGKVSDACFHRRERTNGQRTFCATRAR